VAKIYKKYAQKNIIYMENYYESLKSSLPKQKEYFEKMLNNWQRDNEDRFSETEAAETA